MVLFIIPCNVYFGETVSCFVTHLYEHKRDLKPINMSKLKKEESNKETALVKHYFKYKHRIDFINFETLNLNINFAKIKFLESL